MAGKRFELEQVLKYRVDVERMRSQDFAVAKRDFEHASDRLILQETQMEKIANEFCQRHGELGCIEELRMYANFFSRKREEIKDQKERIELLGHVMNDRRETLLNATKDKKVLESLKDKKAKEFRQTMNQKEQAFMDEISIQKKGGHSR